MDRIQYYRAFILLSVFLLSACAHQGSQQYSRVTIHHPGKYELVYHDSVKGFPGYKMATVDGREIIVTEDVVIPSAQSLYLLSHAEIKEGETVLDIGTGSGVQSIFAADKAKYVVATDISQKATEIAALNIKRHKLSNKIEVRQGDLFGPIKEDEKFDVVLFNIKYPYNKSASKLWKVHERFFQNVRKHLNPGGRIYYQSGLIRNIRKINHMARSNGMRVISMRMDAAIRVSREPIVYLIMRNADLQTK